LESDCRDIVLHDDGEEMKVDVSNYVDLIGVPLLRTAGFGAVIEPRVACGTNPDGFEDAAIFKSSVSTTFLSAAS
jgi:hypothetical protein